MHIGEVIRKYRDVHKMSLQAFADKCGLTKGYVAMLERGINPKTGREVIPSVETFMKISMAVHMPLERLVGLLGEGVPETLIRWLNSRR